MAFNSGEPPSAIAEKWTERELRELGVLFAHEPPLEERFDFWMAQLLAAGINPWRKARSPAVQPKDLTPDWWGEKSASAPKSNAQWRDVLRGMALAFGGKVG